MQHWKELEKNAQGHLMLGGCDTVRLAEEFGTPLYVMEEDVIRGVCRGFYKRIHEQQVDAQVCYAGKAFLNTAMCRIVESEGLGLDVVSGGELYTAIRAGFPREKMYFHGNTKPLREIEMAVDYGVHAIVIDNLHEIDHIADIAKAKDKVQGVYVRVKPCIEAHTHDFIKTARDDAKFGLGIADGDAIRAIKKILTIPQLELRGIHAHIGSQIFELDPFVMAVDVLTDFVLAVRTMTGFEIPEVNFGGGYGIHYLAEDKPLEPWAYVDTLITALKEMCAKKGIALPKFVIEPGRSIVGEAGTTLYTVSSLKEIAGVINYVNCDGSLADNPRPALYGAKYTCVLANRMNEPCDYTATIAGRSCESSDLLIHGATIPRPQSGDLLAVFSTGAYNYSMCSNYNRLGIPAVVLVKDGKAELMVRRQAIAEILSYDMMPSWL